MSDVPPGKTKNRMQKPLRRLDAGYMTASFYPRNQKFLLFTIDSTHASIYGINNAKNLFPWDVQEATSIMDLKDSVLEATKNAAISMGSAILGEFPFVAFATKALQACYNAYTLDGQNLAGENVFKGIPTAAALGKVAQHLSVVMAEHHAATLFKMPNKKPIGKMASFLQFFSTRKTKGYPPKELAVIDATRMMRGLMSWGGREINPESVEGIMLDSIYYTDNEMKKNKVQPLDIQEKNQHCRTVKAQASASAQLAQSIAPPVAPAATHMASASVPPAVTLGAKISSSGPVAAASGVNSTPIAALASKKSPQISGGMSPNP